MQIALALLLEPLQQLGGMFEQRGLFVGRRVPRRLVVTPDLRRSPCQRPDRFIKGPFVISRVCCSNH